MLRLYSLILLISYATATNIDYFDNDLLTVCRPLHRQLDLLFILDGSGSVNGETFATQMQMLNKIIELVEIGPTVTQIAVLQYASHNRLEFPFGANADKRSLRLSLSKIRHLTGITKTGKALDKALQVFQQDPSARRRENVAQVAVVVTDGHSRDDPVPAAQRLRQAGVQILALGIGGHINMQELHEVTGDESLAFQDLDSKESLEAFVDQFKRIAVGEHCEFAKGPTGAEVICSRNTVTVTTQTINRFHGHLFIAGQFADPECRAETTTNEVSLKVRLGECGIQRQIMHNPRGILFETKLILKYHPNYSTRYDRVFPVQCFYGEDGNAQGKAIENGSSIVEVGQSSESSGKEMPCHYQLHGRSNDCMLEDTNIGEELIHRWTCNKDAFDTYQSMLVHSCFVVDPVRNVEKMIIDQNGCTLDPSIMDTPDYVEPLGAFSHGYAVMIPDSEQFKLKCSIKFCDRLMNECEKILPPKCLNRRSTAPENNRTEDPVLRLRARRQTFEGRFAYAEVQREYQSHTVAPLVTFPHVPKRRKLTTQKPQSVQKVVAHVAPPAQELDLDPLPPPLPVLPYTDDPLVPLVPLPVLPYTDDPLVPFLNQARGLFVTEPVAFEEPKHFPTLIGVDLTTTITPAETLIVHELDAEEFNPNPVPEPPYQLPVDTVTSTTAVIPEAPTTTVVSPINAEVVGLNNPEQNNPEQSNPEQSNPEQNNPGLNNPEQNNPEQSNPEQRNQLEPVKSPATTIENIVTSTPIPELPPTRKLDDNWQIIGLAEDLMKSTALNAMEVTSQSITVYEMRHQRDPKAQNQWCRQR